MRAETVCDVMHPDAFTRLSAGFIDVNTCDASRELVSLGQAEVVCRGRIIDLSQEHRDCLLPHLAFEPRVAALGPSIAFGLSNCPRRPR